MKRPKPFEVRPPSGPAVHAAPIRPPGPRSPGWYWRCVVYEAGAERTVWTGRGTEDDIRAEVWQLIGRGEHRDAPAVPHPMYEPDPPRRTSCRAGGGYSMPVDDGWVVVREWWGMLAVSCGRRVPALPGAA